MSAIPPYKAMREKLTDEPKTTSIAECSAFSRCLDASRIPNYYIKGL